MVFPWMGNKVHSPSLFYDTVSVLGLCRHRHAFHHLGRIDDVHRLLQAVHDLHQILLVLRVVVDERGVRAQLFVRRLDVVYPRQCNITPLLARPVLHDGRRSWCGPSHGFRARL